MPKKTKSTKNPNNVRALDGGGVFTMGPHTFHNDYYSLPRQEMSLALRSLFYHKGSEFPVTVYSGFLGKNTFTARIDHGAFAIGCKRFNLRATRRIAKWATCSGLNINF